MASATFQLRAADETAQAFASVQNNLQRLKNTTTEAGRALTKNLDVKDVFRSLALAVGLSADKIANKIAELITGQTEEVIRLQDELVKAGEEATASAAALQKAKNTDIQNVRMLQNEERRLMAIVERKPVTLQEQVNAQKSINELNKTQIELAKIYREEFDKIVSLDADYVKLQKDRKSVDEDLAQLLGLTIDREDEYNEIVQKRAALMEQMDALDLTSFNSVEREKRNALEQEYIDLTRQQLPLEKERRKLSMDAGQILAQGFEDAVLAGGNLRQMLQAITQDLLRLIFRQQITAPLAGFLGEAIFKGFRAEGGPVGAGSAYMVGEKGPELFVPGSSGSIVPNGAMGGGGGNGGASVNVTYNIASGVTRAELKPILEQQRAQLRREIPDAVRRGGSYRTAFA
jgi:hypothetical protein